MKNITNKELVDKAKSVIKIKRIEHGHRIGTVGSALLSEKGQVYTGVCIDLVCGLGFCAEASAIAAMVTAGEYKIKKIVAVAADGAILYPCGRCRELIHQIHPNNINAKILVNGGKVKKLKNMLPYVWEDSRS